MRGALPPGRLFDGRPFLILTIVDCLAREALLTAPKQSFRACHVADELDRPVRLHGKPRSIRVGNGPELAGRLLDQQASLDNAESDFSRDVGCLLLRGRWFRTTDLLK